MLKLKTHALALAALAALLLAACAPASTPAAPTPLTLQLSFTHQAQFAGFYAADQNGWMTPEIWAGMDQTLRRQGVVSNALDVAQVYTLSFPRNI